MKKIVILVVAFVCFSFEGMASEEFAFLGESVDAETGLVFLRARHYDVENGVFLSPDPIGVAGGMNRYQYALQNPVNFVDRGGNTPAWVAGFVGGALWGVGAQIVADVIKGERSGWEDYVGSAVGGAVFSDFHRIRIE